VFSAPALYEFCILLCKPVQNRCRVSRKNAESQRNIQKNGEKRCRVRFGGRESAYGSPFMSSPLMIPVPVSVRQGRTGVRSHAHLGAPRRVRARIRTHTHAYARTCTHARVRTHARTCTRMHARVRTCVCTHTHAYTHTHARTHARVRVCTRMHVHTQAPVYAKAF